MNTLAKPTLVSAAAVICPGGQAKQSAKRSKPAALIHGRRRAGGALGEAVVNAV